MSRAPSSRGLIDHVVGPPTLDRLEALLTTTFDLESDFVDRDFLPSLLRLPTLDDFSYRARMQIEAELTKLSAASVLMEARRFQGRPRSLRVNVTPARLTTSGVLHAKVTVAVHESAVRLTVASANLTSDGYRHNREVALVIEASAKRGSEAKLLLSALAPMRSLLAPWWNADAESAATLAEARLKPWARDATADDDVAFLWSGGDRALVDQFAAQWPRGESVKRIRIVSPFWSDATDAGPLSLLLRALKARKADTDGAEVTLVCAAAPDTTTTWAPSLPASYASFDFSKLGVSVEAIAAQPNVDKEDGGNDKVQIERRLHAKVVVIDGASTSLAYLGSANFSLPGWGFTARAGANIEAGVAMRAGVRGDPHRSLVPPTTGAAVKLTGDGRARIHASVSDDDEVIAWPAFLLRAELRERAGAEVLDLALDVDPERLPDSWSLSADEHTAPLQVTSTTIPHARVVELGAEALTTVLRNQSVFVRWTDCPNGMAYPINVTPKARAKIPLGDPNQRPSEADLIAFFQGRISLDDVYPPPDDESQVRSGSAQALDSAVDTSRILAYQVRSFVEALPGIRQELKNSAVSEQSIRVSALGPVSPVALAREIVRAVDDGRSGVAAGFQLTELILCIDAARSSEVPDALRAVWSDVLGESRAEVLKLLTALCARDVNLSKGSSFDEFVTEMLGPKAVRP